MKITKDLGLYRQVEEYEYTPTPEELFYYYGGTHAGFTRNNPYRVSGTYMTTRKLIKLAPKPEGKPNE